MKFVIYRGEQKFTVENAMVHDMQSFKRLMEDMALPYMMQSEMMLYNVKITSMSGIPVDEMEIEDEEINKEIYYGINWFRETVN